MIKLSDTFYKRMFFVGALWNYSFAIPGIFLPSFMLLLTYGPEMDQSLLLGNYYAYWMYIFWFLAVAVFGIGYYIVSRDIEKNHGVVWLGIIGKLIFFIYLAASYFIGKATILALLAGTGDFIFTIFFISFLYQVKTGNL